MARLPLMAAAALVLVASPSLLCATMGPAAAQEWNYRGGGIDDRDLRDFLSDEFRSRRDRRDLLLDLIRERGDRRERLRERIAERRGENRNCYFFNGSLGDEDRDLFVVVRGRICRD